MCVALPGIVKELKADKAIVDFNGNIVEVRAGFVPVKVGDSVLVHAGCILQKVSAKEAEDMNELFKEFVTL